MVLTNLFKKFFYRIDNKESVWIIMSVDAEYVNTSVYSPLSGGTYINLPCELTKSMKDLINIKNPGNKCFLLCHIKHWNPKKKKKQTSWKKKKSR